MYSVIYLSRPAERMALHVNTSAIACALNAHAVAYRDDVTRCPCQTARKSESGIRPVPSAGWMHFRYKEQQ